jgi:hypothetical protein
LEASVITLSPIYVCSFANAHEGLPADHANAVCHSFQAFLYTARLFECLRDVPHSFVTFASSI